MKTEIVKINPSSIDEEKIHYCGQILKSGGLVCFPTETVYGLGANAFSEESVLNIFKAKGRPADNPLIVHISNLDMLSGITNCTGTQRDLLLSLAKVFWPGPLTIIVSKHDNIPAAVSCGLDTVGIRFPSHPIAHALIESAKVPVAAPSANISGKPSPTEAKHVIEDMNGKVDVIIDGDASEFGVESTVLDITSKPACILRPGAVTLKMLKPYIPDVTELGWKNTKTIDKPRSPGMKYKHYAPKAIVTIYHGEETKTAEFINQKVSEAIESGLQPAVLATDQTLKYYNNVKFVLSLGDRNDGLSQSAKLFSGLRKFDELGVDVVFAEAVPETGVGDAVMNRMYRAAGCNIVEV